MKHPFEKFPINSRGGRLKINIISGFALKGCSMALSLIFIPIVLSYLTSYKYGIWLTINSVISWFSMMDIGLSGGLRLKLQDSLTKKDWVTSRKYISSTYSLLFLIAIVCIVILAGLVLFLDLNYASFFKVEDTYNAEIRNILLITIVCFFLRFSLQPISVILAADQMDFVQSILLLMEQILNFLGILLLTAYTEQSLLYASVLFSITPLLNLSLFSVLFFTTKYRFIRPQIGRIDRECISPLMSVGLDMFITSISMIFIIQSNNILITKVFSPNEVTIYNLVLKLFATISAFYTLLISPLWSAFGNAFAKGDILWVANVFKKISRMMGVFTLIYGVLVLFAPMILRLWTGMDISDYILITSCAIYFIAQNIESTYAYLFNGSGRKKYIKLQRNLMIYGALVNIPLILIFSEIFKWGLYAIFIANIIAVLPRTIIYTKQGRLLLRESIENHK